jgi:hypothetical protein
VFLAISVLFFFPLASFAQEPSEGSEAIQEIGEIILDDDQMINIGIGVIILIIIIDDRCWNWSNYFNHYYRSNCSSNSKKIRATIIQRCLKKKFQGIIILNYFLGREFLSNIF